MHKRYKLLLVILVISTLLSLAGCKKNQVPMVNNSEKIKELKISDSAESNEDWLRVNVYFDGSIDETKAQSVKEERVLNREELVGEVIVQELIKGPSLKSKLKPIFSKDTKLLSFSIKDKIAYVNLNSNATHNMTAIREEACLRSIALSLTQLETVDKVKILIDSKNIDSLGGNFDISKPFSNEDISSIKNK